MTLERIGTLELDAEQLMSEHAPRFSNERKPELIGRITAPISGTLFVSRWQGTLPATTEAAGDPEFELTGRGGVSRTGTERPAVSGRKRPLWQRFLKRQPIYH